MRDPIEAYALFDESQGINTLGDIGLLREMAELFITELVTVDEPALQLALDKRNYEQLGHIAHKIKGGALYCGASRLVAVCIFVESRCKAVADDLFAENMLKAYGLLRDTIEATHAAIGEWLQKSQSI